MSFLNWKLLNESSPTVIQSPGFKRLAFDLWIQLGAPISLSKRMGQTHFSGCVGSGGIEKSHSCKWAKWIQWHALPHIQQSTQQRNKGYYPNLHGWDFSIPPSPLCGAHYTSSTSSLLPCQHCRLYTHLYTWVERSNYGKVPYSRTQHVARKGARTHTGA